jgi:hypothetical protein
MTPEKNRRRRTMLDAKGTRALEEPGHFDCTAMDWFLERARALVAAPGDVPVDDIRDYVDRSIDRRLKAELGTREGRPSAAKMAFGNAMTRVGLLLIRHGPCGLPALS